MATKPASFHGLLTVQDDHIWGGGNEPMPTPPIVIPPDAIEPGVPTHPIYIPVFPAHPIVIPPDSIAPGVPTHPIVLPPPIPTHPIVIPPDAVAPGVPTHPIYLPPGIWGPTDPRPSNPIAGIPGLPGYTPPVLPPGGTPLPPAVNVPVEGKLVFVPGYGWIFVPSGIGEPGEPENPEQK